MKENVPGKDPGDAESRPCKPESSGPTREDKSSLRDHPSRRSSLGPRGVLSEGRVGTATLLSSPLSLPPPTPASSFQARGTLLNRRSAESLGSWRKDVTQERFLESDKIEAQFRALFMLCYF